MAKGNPFAGKKAPAFGKGGAKGNPFAKKKGGEEASGAMPFKKGGKVGRK